MNAIIYVRVSTNEQAEFGYSLKAQEEICFDFAKRNKYEVVKVFVEKGESAKTLNRPVLKEMLEYARLNKNKIDALIIYKIDRLSRNSLECLSLRYKLDKYDIDLKSVTEPFDDSAMGTFTADLFSIVAQLENNVRSERTKIGMKQAVKEGRWLWNAPFGYTNEYINNKSYLKPTEDASIVKKVFADFISGKKQYEIANDLSLSGVNITKQHLNNMLRNPLYIGKLKTNFFDELITGLHEPIIDEITFYKAQEILNPSKKNTYNIKYNDLFPLKKFLKCPDCNRYLAASFSKGRHKRYPYYHCTTKGCTYKPIRADYAEYLFLEYLKSFEMNKDFINDLFDNAKEFLSGIQQDNKNLVAYIKKEITLLEEKKSKIEDFVLDGTFTKETYLKKSNEIESEIISKKIQFHDYEDQLLNVDELIGFGRQFFLNLSSFWIKLDTPRKRCLQEMLFSEGIYIENNKFRTANISPILSLIEGKKDLKKELASSLAGERGFEPLLYGPDPYVLPLDDCPV